METNIQSNQINQQPVLKEKTNMDLINKVTLQQIQQLKELFNNKLGFISKMKPYFQDTQQKSITASPSTIIFGNVLTSLSTQLKLSFFNHSHLLHKIKIKIIVDNPKLRQLPYYIFCFRVSQGQENICYTDEISINIPPKKQQFLVLAVKTPQLLKNQQVTGTIHYRVDQFQYTYQIPISVNVVVPMIHCLKLLQCQQGYQVIKIAYKKFGKNELKIPFKNLSKLTITYEVHIFELDNNDCKEINYSLIPYSKIITCKSYSPFLVVVLIKNNFIKKEQLKILNLKYILLLKIKNGNGILSYPIDLKIYQ